MAEKDFLGRGWGFPPTFNKTIKGVEMVENEDDINSSLEILFSTRIGERIMQPKYGCNLDELMFESLTTTLATFIKDLIETAILYFETRIDVNKIDLEQVVEQGLIIISLDYRVRATNSRGNFVYPFYQNEGTNIN